MCKTPSQTPAAAQVSILYQWKAVGIMCFCSYTHTHTHTYLSLSVFICHLSISSGLLSSIYTEKHGFTLIIQVVTPQTSFSVSEPVTSSPTVRMPASIILSILLLDQSSFMDPIHNASLSTHDALSPYESPPQMNILVSLTSERERGFPDSSVGKESACNAVDLGSISGSGRSPGEGKGYPLQDS